MNTAVAKWGLIAIKALLTLAFLAAGYFKLTGNEMMVGTFDAIGWGQWFRYVTGAIEVGGAVLLWVPGLQAIAAAVLGATMVGAIVQTYSPDTDVKKGQEKGWFAFGGSTIIVLCEKTKVQVDPDILENDGPFAAIDRPPRLYTFGWLKIASASSSERRACTPFRSAPSKGGTKERPPVASSSRS